MQEEGENLPPEKVNPFLDHDFDNEIVNKYKKKHPVDEARQDAFRYAVSSLAYFLYESLYPRDQSPSEINYVNEELASWQRAIDEARSGNWKELKGILQKEARSAIAAGGYRLDMARHFGWEPEVQEKSAMESDDRGLALTNFANSIG